MSNNPGSVDGDIKWKSENIPYHSYEFIGLILYAYWGWIGINLRPVNNKFSNTAYPNEVGKWLKDYGAELIAGHTWRLPSEEIKVLFLLRWS